MRRGYVLPQENFCLNKASAAGNTSRIVKAVNTVQAEIIRGSAYSLRTRPHKKKSKPGFSLLFKIYTKQKGGSAFSKSGFSFILLGCALE